MPKKDNETDIIVNFFKIVSFHNLYDFTFMYKYGFW